MMAASAEIMIVEDEVVVAMELEEALKAMGYRVNAIVSSGEEAISRVDKVPPDLILMDIKLHGDLDGIETAGRIRERHDIPVVYLTAYADEHRLNRAKMTEPYGYLIKPTSERELRTTIEVCLYRHQQEKKIKDSAVWLSATLNILGEAVIVSDSDGIIKHMNYSAETLTGWSQESAFGKHFTEVYVLRDQKTGEILENPVPMPLKAGTVQGSARHILVSKNQTEINIEHNVVPVHDSKGNLTGVVLAFQDFSQHGGETQASFGHAANLYVSAALYCSEGQYSKAEPLYRRALMLFERNLGSDHPKVANVLTDLADVYTKMGKPEEAKKLADRATEIRRSRKQLQT
ncbi:MAG: response regulator [Desulfomonile tiedjei]|nr:response regulator [Desulfomonile tiedjei]